MATFDQACRLVPPWPWRRARCPWPPPALPKGPARRRGLRAERSARLAGSLSSRLPEHRAVELGERGSADQHHRHLELRAQDVDRALHAFGPSNRQAVAVRTADEDGGGAECDRLDDVGAAA